MVYDSRRDCLHLEVGHSVCSNNHCAVLLIEGIYKFLNYVLICIYIIGIQLDCKLAAFRVVESRVPVAANSVVRGILRNVNKLLVAYKLLDYLCCTVI